MGRLIRCLRRAATGWPPSQTQSSPWRQLLEDEQLCLLGAIKSCQAAELRGPRSLKCSKQETAQAILDILGHFRDRPLTLALALEALLQLSRMRPKFSCDMISAILHRTLEAVLKGTAKEEEEEEEEREELKRHFRLLLGSLLMEAPNPGTLLHLLSVSVPMASGVVLGWSPPIPYPTDCPISGAQSLFGPQFGPRPKLANPQGPEVPGTPWWGQWGPLWPRLAPDSETLFPPSGPPRIRPGGKWGGSRRSSSKQEFPCCWPLPGNSPTSE
ncbi:Hypothetical predicted protein [Podarcis lilfordi]|uniref:Uncharacterized protein n=1 Tax=Podarcis lilfordi TaxID=74358 RepID=A0AA35K267_9SAUR|nr:Hypothetical predicted protein [Podarcis lilfordi]